MGTSTSFARLLAVLAVLGMVWLLADLVVPALGQQKPDQPPPKEEEYEKPKGKKGDEEEEDPRAKGQQLNRGVFRNLDKIDKDQPRPAAAGSFDLKAESKAAKHKRLRDFYFDLAEPHDLVSIRSAVGVSKVEPLKIDIIDDKTGDIRFTGTLKMNVFKEGEWVHGSAISRSAGGIIGVKYFEKFALEAVDDFLKAPVTGLSRPEVLLAAQRALTEVINFHDGAVAAGERPGERFKELGISLKRKLLTVRLEQLAAIIKSEKGEPVSEASWDEAIQLARELTLTAQDDQDRARIVVPMADAVKAAIKNGVASEEHLKRFREIRLLFPNSKATAPIDEQLRKEAESLFDKAKHLFASDQPGAKDKALALIKQAEAWYPGLPDMLDHRLKWDNQLAKLRVGVRELPTHLSPALAFSDSDKQAVELLFESLVKLGLDAEGNPRWQPGLAEGMPKILPLGRRFQLARDVLWSDGKPVTPEDVVHTVRLLRNPAWKGHSPVWAGLIEAPTGGDASGVLVPLSQGYIDPLSMMSFKLLPVEWQNDILAPGVEAKFDKAPVGTGPFKYAGQGQVQNRTYLSFVANPAYSGRAGKKGLPRIREVQFFKTTDPAADLRLNLLDLVIDVPNKTVKSIATLRGTVAVKTPTRVPEVGGFERPLPPNRRVYFLAINHRQNKALKNPDFRKALAHAIDRDALLDAAFRDDFVGKEYHKPLNGPFPAGSWACDPGLAFKKEIAQARIKAAEEQGIKDVKLSLVHPDDPEITFAMQQLARQVQETIGVTLELKGLSSDKLHDEVEVHQKFDLAYCRYDFPGQSYWLWPLFDPNSTKVGGTNYMGYENDGAMESQFRLIASRREFKEVKTLTHTLHGMLFDKMPLVPLWQLDVHLAVHNDLQATITDPLLVFSDVDQWRFDKKR